MAVVFPSSAAARHCCRYPRQSPRNRQRHFPLLVGEIFGGLEVSLTKDSKSSSLGALVGDMLMLVPGRVSLKQESSTIVYTPWKINMEPKNDDLEDVYFPFPMGDIFRFHVTFRGSMFRHLI